MVYEYLSILLVESGNSLEEDHQEHLNNYFNNGWEYVDSITQSIAAGYRTHGAVMVIIKKEKSILP